MVSTAPLRLALIRYPMKAITKPRSEPYEKEERNPCEK
jgi:hypothetical protein